VGGLDPQLVIEFSYPILMGANEKLSITVFTEPADNGRNRVPTSMVLEHLARHKPGLRIHYLETMIRQFGEKTPEHHNELVKLYLEAVLSHPGYEGTRDTPTREVVAGNGDDAIVRRRKKLIAFLEHTPQRYEAAKVLEFFPEQELFQERAVLLRAIGQHEAALAIYAHRLCDDVLAEKYCRSLYKVDQRANKHIYLVLLKVYLTPPPSRPRDCCTDAAMNLLTRYFDRIDAVEALSLLPPEVLAVNSIRTFLEATIRFHNDDGRNLSILRHIAEQERTAVEDRYTMLQRQRVVITEDRECPECGCKISADQVFGVYPDGKVVHYRCMETAESKYRTI